MKKMAIEMPVVTSCQIENCGYNVAKKCHAKAITVGDSFDPECDTFLESNLHIREIRRTAGVGACKVTACRFNHLIGKQNLPVFILYFKLIVRQCPV